MAVAQGSRDRTLVRHVYDLHITRTHYHASEIIALVKDIIPSDVAGYGNKFPAYRDNPIAETIRAIHNLATDEEFARHYSDFLRDMVYGEAPDFKTEVVWQT